MLLTGVDHVLRAAGADRGCPSPHHPVFEREAFRSATTHGFWLSVPVPSSERDDGDAWTSLTVARRRTVEVVKEEE